METVAKQPSDDEQRRREFAALVDTYYNKVLGYCLRFLRDDTLGEDATQQTFVEAFRDFDGFERKSAPLSWLLGIAHHRCLDASKARGQRQLRLVADDDAMESVVDPSASPADRADATQRSAALEACLAKLSELARAAVLLRFWHDLSFEEMAVILDEKADTLNARVTRAFKALRACLSRKQVRP